MEDFREKLICSIANGILGRRGYAGDEVYFANQVVEYADAIIKAIEIDTELKNHGDNKENR